MANHDAVKTAFARWGSEHGYRKKSTRWYLDGDDVLVVVDLQKSQYGRAYYVNVAFWLRELGDDPSPPENRCHVRTRLEKIANVEDELPALNLEIDIPVERRERMLESLLAHLDDRVTVLRSVRSLKNAMEAGWNPVTVPAARQLFAQT